MTEERHREKFSFVADRQKEQHATVRLVLSSPSCRNFQCDIGSSIYHRK